LSVTAHHYRALLTWTGADQGPTRDYATYSRAFTAAIAGKAIIAGSSDPAFRGDPQLLNPEELLLIALSSCHMLSYLALCANSKIQVESYTDQAEGTLAQQPDKGWAMSEVVLRPRVAVSPGSSRERALALHERAHQICFIARSVNFPVRAEPNLVEAPPASPASPE
jgi:organic hydroperoxide reductase OsmC/OhrA